MTLARCAKKTIIIIIIITIIIIKITFFKVDLVNSTTRLINANHY